MDRKSKRNHSFSYSTLFNLEVRGVRFPQFLFSAIVVVSPLLCGLEIQHVFLFFLLIGYLHLKKNACILIFIEFNILIAFFYFFVAFEEL